MNTAGAYVLFCDENSLKRVDATPADHVINLYTMEEAVLALRREYKDREVVTPAMMTAGIAAFDALDTEYDAKYTIVLNVYRAMRAAQ